MNKAVFLDKDGTLIQNVPYNIDTSLIRLDETAVEALTLLQNKDYLLIVVSNQGGIAKGYFGMKEVDNANRYIASLLLQAGVKIDAFYYCPHHPDGIITEYAVKCSCRKPEPGLLLKAAEELSIDLSASWMIGDILDDVEAGNRAGCHTILYNNGNETQWKTGEYRIPRFTVNNLYDAAGLVDRVGQLINSKNYV